MIKEATEEGEEEEGQKERREEEERKSQNKHPPISKVSRTKQKELPPKGKPRKEDVKQGNTRKKNRCSRKTRTMGKSGPTPQQQVPT